MKEKQDPDVSSKIILAHEIQHYFMYTMGNRWVGEKELKNHSREHNQVFNELVKRGFIERKKNWQGLWEISIKRENSNIQINRSFLQAGAVDDARSHAAIMAVVRVSTVHGLCDNEGMKKAAVISPYWDTLGGGEKYLFMAAFTPIVQCPSMSMASFIARLSWSSTRKSFSLIPLIDIFTAP